jgi:hypothetical protein
VINLSTGKVMLSDEGVRSIYIPNVQQMIQTANINLVSMARLIRTHMFFGRAIPVIEVDQGLLQMMEVDGYMAWRAIRDNFSQSSIEWMGFLGCMTI